MTSPTLVPLTVPAPKDLGLDHFLGWREGQAEILEKILNWYHDSDTQILMINAPPGIGKSLVAAMTMLHLAEEDPAFTGVITTSRVALQQQYINETFKHHVATAAWGRGNHDCLIMPELTVDQAPCQSGYKCAKKDDCPYFVERDIALESKITVLNTMFWLTLANFAHNIEGAQGRSLAIHDEAHFMEGTIRDLVSASLNARFWKGQGISFPSSNSTQDWRDWLMQHSPHIKTLALSAQRKIRAGDSPGQYRAVLRAHEAVSKIQDFILPSHPLISRTQWGVKFEPIWGNDFADDILWRNAERHILMSATLNPEYTAGTLNLERDQYEVIDLDSPFHPMRRRVLYRPVIKVNAKTTDAQFLGLVQEMDKMLDGHPDQRGIIHSVSYKRAEQIIKMSRHRDRMFTHRSGNQQDKADAIDELIGSDDGILVSPSVGVGEDFGRGDNVRFQFFVKYPIPYLGDPVVKARVGSWKDSLWFEADQAFVQGIGRGTRAADDWCVNYVLDAGAGWRFSHLPAYVQDSIVYPTQQ